MWDALLESIFDRPQGRSSKARWFKPVFLIAVIDDLDARGVNAEADVNFNPHDIGQKYVDLVPTHLKARARKGWREPFSYLSTDKAWQFSLQGGGGEIFQSPLRRPLTNAQMNSPSFQILIPDKNVWALPQNRQELRRALLARMANDEDTDCHQIAELLRFTTDDRSNTTRNQGSNTLRRGRRHSAQLATVIEAFPEFPDVGRFSEISRRALDFFKRRGLVQQRKEGTPIKVQERLMQQYCPGTQLFVKASKGLALFQKSEDGLWGLREIRERTYANAGVTPISSTKPPEGQGELRRRGGAPPPTTIRQGVMHLRHAQAYTYLMQIEGASELAFKIGWAFEYTSRQKEFNQAALPVLGGLRYVIRKYHLWDTAKQAFKMEQELLSNFEKNRHSANREVIFGISFEMIEAAWGQFVAKLSRRSKAGKPSVPQNTSSALPIF
jgi:hypothetical protein